MPGQNILGKCPDCCGPCSFSDRLPNTIFFTVSGVVACSCAVTVDGNYHATDLSVVNTTITATKTSPGTWTASIGNVLVDSFAIATCTGPSSPISIPYTIQIKFTTSGSDCQLQVLIFDNSGTTGTAAFAFFGNVDSSTFLSPVSNDLLCGSNAVGSGGTGTIST